MNTVALFIAHVGLMDRLVSYWEYFVETLKSALFSPPTKSVAVLSNITKIHKFGTAELTLILFYEGCSIPEAEVFFFSCAFLKKRILAVVAFRK
jgi:hypothetical protein